MCHLCAARAPGDVTAPLDTHSAPARAISGTSVTQFQQIADYLRAGFWADTDDFFPYDQPRAFNINPGGTLEVDLTRLSKAEQFVAKSALQAWTDVSGIKFREVSRSAKADIEFTTGDSGAYSFSNLGSDGDGDGVRTILKSFVNIQKNWDSDPVSVNSYWFQTYLHEIGHALGLGHAGNYDGDASFGPDHTFTQDSWQASVMSYFAQTDNPNIDGDFAFVATAMPADILAIQDIYGSNVNTRSGNTVYGHNSNVGGYLRQLSEVLFDGAPAERKIFINNPAALTIFDADGNDTLNFSTVRARQVINLNDATASDVGGLQGNMLIAVGTLIENAIGGKGRDRITGNEAANRIFGMQGSDAVFGGDGRDSLSGGAGRDTLDGGGNEDTALYTGGGNVAVNLSKTAGQNTGQGTDRLSEIENVTSGRGNDRLTGDDAANRLKSGAGRDRLAGGDGEDLLSGGTGNDRLQGQLGTDSLGGGAGNDVLAGGDGDDRLAGGAGNDILSGQTGDDTMIGGAGRDVFLFTGGQDVISDFANDTDTIRISRDALDAGVGTVAELLALAIVLDGNVVLNFVSGDSLTILGVTSIASLQNDFQLV